MSAAKRARMTGHERREQLVGVARSLFAQRGYAETSIEEIAERAGVSKPVVYSHFGGKEGVYAVVVDREVTALTERISAALDAEHPRETAEQAADAFLSYIEDHEDGFRILLRDAPAARPPDVNGSGAAPGSLASVISEVAERAERLLVSEFRERGFDRKAAPMYARMLVGAVALVGEWWVDVRKPSRQVVAAHVVNLLWNGLKDLDPKPARER